MTRKPIEPTTTEQLQALKEKLGKNKPEKLTPEETKSLVLRLKKSLPKKEKT